MSASGGNTAIIAALLANVGIAITKIIAWLISGSASLLAEAIHSFADSANQLLLLLGGRLSRRKADSEHPFGYGRERYVWAFIVSLVLFSVGGVFSIIEGIEKLQEPHEITNVLVPIIVLVVAIVMESFSLRTAVKESAKVKGDASWWRFIRTAKAPELPVVLLEDTAALTGLVFALAAVGLSAITGNPVFDAIGTLMIGALLIVVAAVLAVEMKSLLVGEGANAEDARRIQDALHSSPDVVAIIHMKTLYLGPEELLVAAKIAFDPAATLETVARAIDDVEKHVREQVPIARVIYLEPDIQAAVPGVAVSTDFVVIQSGN